MENQTNNRVSGRDEEYLTAKEVAEFLKLSKWSIYKLMAPGGLPYVELNMKGGQKPTIRFPKGEVIAWMAKRTINSRGGSHERVQTR